QATSAYYASESTETFRLSVWLIFLEKSHKGRRLLLSTDTLLVPNGGQSPLRSSPLRSHSLVPSPVLHAGKRLPGSTGQPHHWRFTACWTAFENDLGSRAGYRDREGSIAA